MHGWSNARAFSATQLRTNPNAYFYRHVEPDEEQVITHKPAACDPAILVCIILRKWSPNAQIQIKLQKQKPRSSNQEETHRHMKNRTIASNRLRLDHLHLCCQGLLIVFGVYLMKGI